MGKCFDLTSRRRGAGASSIDTGDGKLARPSAGLALVLD
jgi:hypothetical protein